MLTFQDSHLQLHSYVNRKNTSCDAAFNVQQIYSQGQLTYGYSVTIVDNIDSSRWGKPDWSTGTAIIGRNRNGHYTNHTDV